jgi:hypothetical protein
MMGRQTADQGALFYEFRLAEAIIPINDESGDIVGGVVQLHFFLDDIFLTTLGKPIF